MTLNEDTVDTGDSWERLVVHVVTTGIQIEDARQRVEQQLGADLGARSVEWVEIEDGVRVQAQIATADPFYTMSAVCCALAARFSIDDIRSLHFERV